MKKSSSINKDVLDKATEALGSSNKSQNLESEKPKHGLRTTDVESHFDGSHTVRHTPHKGGEQISYAVKNTKELLEKLKHYLSGNGENLPADESRMPEHSSDQSVEQPLTGNVGG